MTRREKQIIADRIQRAVTGLQIPMMQITKLYKHAEKLIAQGADDFDLRAGIKQFLHST